MRTFLPTIFFLLLLVVPSFGQTQGYMEAREQALQDAKSLFKANRNKQRNIYIDSDKVIHIFMFEDGSLLLSGFPTTATERNQFQIHLYTKSTNSDNYILESAGNYEPSLNIEGDEKKTAVTTINRRDFAILGPFTNSVTFTLKRSSGGAEYKTVNQTNVKVAKTVHASVGTGFVYSTLRNPTNIRVVTLDGNTDESTLLADNPQGNAGLTLMATLYPWGRNSLMMQSMSLKDRTGIVIGTTIASDERNFENLYLGAQIDFAVGGSIVLGADIAERQMIYGVDYKDFEFGKTTFTGEIDSRLYDKVGVGFFIGVQVDSRIFARMFGG